MWRRLVLLGLVLLLRAPSLIVIRFGLWPVVFEGITALVLHFERERKGGDDVSLRSILSDCLSRMSLSYSPGTD
jgi:hypothetical protein